MTNKNSATKRHVYKTMASPVGQAHAGRDRTTASAAMLWENDRPGRVRLNIEAEETEHPVLVEAERQLEEYFAGRRTRST